MKPQWIFTGAVTALLFLCSSTKQLPAAAKAVKKITQHHTRKLVWSDEFNAPGKPDTTKWGYNIGTGENGWGNHEAEYYTSRKKNAVIKNGVLKITAIKEHYKGSSFTAARLLTQNKFAITYGRIEARIKLPAGAGTWPAFWMLGNNVDSAGWPNCGEIDIMEHRGKELNTIFGTLHYPEHFGDHANGKTTMINTATTAFHVYAVEWTEKTIDFFIDDQLYFTVPNTADMPFHHSFFIILNLAMGGDFGGAIDTAIKKATMEVDYVRVYE
ncbi:MAG: glycoside hydrolase family 16 protein [Bacteroidetes bacterium]|nr:glycoside hydrolase family 16 protein [Bacteroidota bacterium]